MEIRSGLFINVIWTAFPTWTQPIKTRLVLYGKTMAQIWKEVRINTRAPASSESCTTCLWACAPGTPRCEQLMAHVSGPSGESCIEIFRFRTSQQSVVALHSYVNGPFLTHQSGPNTCVIYQQTYYMGTKEAHSEPTSEECNSLLCFNFKSLFPLCLPHFQSPYYIYLSTVSFTIYILRWRDGNLTR